MKKAHVKITSLKFSDETLVQVKDGDIIVLVGPNNVGKSAALKNIKDKVGNPKVEKEVVKDLDIDLYGDVDDLVNTLGERFQKAEKNGSYSYGGINFNVASDRATGLWKNHKAHGLQELARAFVYFLDTESRLKAADPAPAINLLSDPYVNPIHYLQYDDEIEEKISSYFRMAFKKDLIVNRGAGSIVPLHVGERPVVPEGKDRVSHSYLLDLAKLPNLHAQGDGMRAFVGVLLHALVITHDVLLIDEPEAFLHPPQARLLGGMLSKNLPDNHQVFISTHSGDFLRGLLDVNNKRIRVVRIRREENVNLISELNNQDIYELWNDPLLRYSNILDGMFHDCVVLGESDSDARFYSALLDAIVPEIHDEDRKDMMFAHCGGKARMPVVVKALRSVSVPVVVITDIDILNDERPLRDIYENLGGDWREIASDWSNVKKSIEKKIPLRQVNDVRREIDEIFDSLGSGEFPSGVGRNIARIARRTSWSLAKEMGRAIIPSGEETQTFSRLMASLRKRRLFIVEVGELEMFVKSVGNHGPKWVNEVLKMDLMNNPELEEARKFVKDIVLSLA